MMSSLPRSARLLLGLALATAACKHDEAAADENAHAVVGAKTVAVKEGPFRETITAIGAVVPRAGSVALLSAPGPTRIANVMVVAGQAVARGTPLVEFEQAPFVARAQSADAALQAADRARDRTQRLVDQGISPRKDLDQAEADVARARADAVSARRDAQLSRLESPIAGVVMKMTAVLGASVDANEPLVEVADPHAVDVLISVTPDQASRVHVAARVTLSAGQGANAESLGTSTVSEVGGAVDPETRAVAIRARGGAVKRTLRIGESVAAEITVAEHPRALSVPVEALVPEGEGFKVFVVDAQGVAHEREVKVGGTTAGMVRVIDGLKAGEQVVSYGAFGVSDSAKVVPPGATESVEKPDAKSDAKADVKADTKGSKPKTP